MSRFLILALAVAGTPALAASGPFFSLANTNFVVLLAFILFIAVLIYFKVPGLLMGLLDKRAVGIQGELEEAKALRDEAQTLLASYKRKQEEMKEQAERILDTARKEATATAEQAKVDLASSIERRLASAEDQIASAQANAIKEVRDQAVTVAIAAAGQVIAGQMNKAQADAMFNAALEDVKAKLH